MTPERLLAIKIIDEFNEVLEKHGIMIPSDDREGDKTEAPIYGIVYCQLENSITEMIEEFVKKEG